MGGNVAGLQIAAVCRQISSQLWCFVVVVVEHRFRPSRGGDFVQTFVVVVVLIIIIMEICKAPTLRLKALNKHTHIMYIEMVNVINIF